MQSGSTYKQDSAFALLLMGVPKSGKTNIAMEFPDPWFADGDSNLTSAIRRHPGKVFYFDSLLTDDNGQPVPPEKRWTRFTEKLIAAAKDPAVKTLVIDSLTTIGPMLIDHIVATGTKLIVGGEKCMEQQHWTPYRNLLMKVINVARASGKYVIFICHESVEKDELLGTINYKPLVSGQLRDNIGAFFTDIWRCENELKMDPKHPGQMMSAYKVRTNPMPRIALGNSLGLPTTFEFTWAEFQRLVELGKKEVMAPTPVAPPVPPVKPTVYVANLQATATTTTQTNLPK